MSPHGICKLRNQLTMLFSVHIFISFLSKKKFHFWVNYPFNQLNCQYST